MAFELDHTESLRETWLWRKAPNLVVLGAILWLVGGEAADWYWQQSLRQSRCTVVAANIEGEIRVSPASGRRFRRRPKGEWVETTTVDFLVDGVGPRRSVQPFTDFVVGQVRDCWISDDEISLYPQVERLGERWSRAITTGILTSR
jgi:hypothetical protein